MIGMKSLKVTKSYLFGVKKRKNSTRKTKKKCKSHLFHSTRSKYNYFSKDYKSNKVKGCLKDFKK